MRILMIAPLPFFQARGAPFQVYHRARVLGEMGHQVDLVVYHVGDDIALPNVRLRRAWRLPFVKSVKVGPSVAKFPLDALLFLKAGSLLLYNRYDCLHTHLEAGFFGATLGRLARLPHVYDMHDDLAETLASSKFTRNPFLIRMMRGVVRMTLRSADSIIIVYPELQHVVDTLAPGKPTTLIHNIAVTAGEQETLSEEQRSARINQVRRELDLPDESRVLLYTGTFEAYQGLDALIDSIPAVLTHFPHAMYVLVGGMPDQIETVRARARALGVEHAVRLPGRRPPQEMPAFMALADVLLSPRSAGTNAPLKLFTYLEAGKPILATDIASNTQILTSDAALLVPYSASALAEGAIQLLSDADLCEALAQHAQSLAGRYSNEMFTTRTLEAYQALAATHAPIDKAESSSLFVR
ncbi:MAG TPA: glycosyltransferase [Ktedonobacterales bacterium]